MASWLPTKTLLPWCLRHILSKTGILEEKAQDLANFNITVGKTNVIELKNVGLNIKQLSKYARLPPCLRVETARILLLRLTIPADIFQSSIIVEVDGVELLLDLVADDVGVDEKPTKRRDRSPASIRTPQHRKTDRRLRSPPPRGTRDLGGEDARIPTTQEMARSFLMEEPLQERRNLEATVAASSKSVDESFHSESSDGENIGTGVSMGLPAFIASFLQGLLDRLKVMVKNVEVKIETHIQSESLQDAPVVFRLRVGTVKVDRSSTSQTAGENATHAKRQVTVHDISVDLLTDSTTLSELSEMPSHASRSQSQQPSQSSPTSDSSPRWQPSVSNQASPVSSNMPDSSPDRHSPGLRSAALLSNNLQSSVSTVDADRFADAGEDDHEHRSRAESSELDIRPGEDNISWGSRRSHSDEPADDLWKSMTSDDDLSDSLLIDHERALTPRVHSSRGSSPLVSRSRRTLSPYDRSRPGPSDSSRRDESATVYGEVQGLSSSRQRSQQRHSASSRVSRSGHAGTLDMSSGTSTAPESFVTDNKKAALRQDATDGRFFEEEVQPREAMDDLAQSQVFDHETARSMYVSAMMSSPKLHVPGGWDSQSQASASRADQATRPLDEVLADGGTGEHSTNEPPKPLSGNVTPRAHSPKPGTHLSEVLRPLAAQTARQLLFIDSVSVSVPTGKGDPPQSLPLPPTTATTTSRPSSHAYGGMPGAFSAYSEHSSPRIKDSGLLYGDSTSIEELPLPHPSPADHSPPVAVVIENVAARLDIATGRLLYGAGSKFLSALPTQPDNIPPTATPDSSTDLAVAVQIHHLRLSLSEQIIAGDDVLKTVDNAQPDVLTLGCENINFSQVSDTRLQISSAVLKLGGKALVAIKTETMVAGPSHIPREIPALLVTKESTKVTAGNHPVSLMLIETAPMDVTLELSVFDDTFASFGGLSGLLELGNSLLSKSGYGSPASPPKPAKGVRFAGEPVITDPIPGLKVNIRLNYITVTLRGQSFSLMLKVDKVKATRRERQISATVGRVELSGPHSDRATVFPAAVELGTLRFDYLPSPADKDLEKLISLLTPSRDKYDNDDDILIPTLLRQRRKGASLKLGIKDARFRVDDWGCTSMLNVLGEEMAKLSAVVKYLPEDDRPGPLILTRIEDLDLQVPVNESFGNIRTSAQNINLAYVGLPALLALSVENINARKPDEPELVHPLTPRTGLDHPPMLMARMLGDEEIPTVKIKVFDVCIEYSAAVLMALAGSDGTTAPNEIVLDMAQSIVNHAVAGKTVEMSPQSSSNSSTPPAKQTMIDVLIHDSAIGLNPVDLPSKALFVLTDVRASTTLPPQEPMKAQLTLRRAELFITDNVNDTANSSALANQRMVHNANSTQKLAGVLGRIGFVSVGSMRSAVIDFRAREGTSTDSKLIKVDVKNELLLLETCADSTQTLFATLGALAPSAPPSLQEKYLTEPMTVEDMMASFTGEPVAKPEARAETLFDVDEEPDDGPSMLYDAETGEDETDELLNESEMMSSLYGPVSGILGLSGVNTDDGDDNDYPETVQSLLEDDPFEMTISPTDMPMSDQDLLRDLRKQCRPAVSPTPVDLGLWEVEDLGFDALGGGQQALGSKHRFNAPFIGSRAKQPAGQRHEFPVTLKLRDFHVIWHLYDGYDWERTRQGIADVVEQVERKAEERKARRRQSLNEREDEESVIGDILFNSIYIGVSADNDAQDLRRKINQTIDDQVSETESGMTRPTSYSGSGQPSRQRQRKRLKLGRSRAHKMSFELKGVSADVVVYPQDSGSIINTVDVRIKDFEIFDNVPQSTWRKFLTHMNNNPAEREISKPMLHIHLENVKTLESHSASELTLEVTVLPLRLHVDQDAQDFTTRFFDFKDKSLVKPGPPGEQPFIQRLEVHTVDLCLDYKPKRIDYVGLRSGQTSEFMNLITLDAANIRLKHAIVYGLRGFDEIHPTLNGIWMPDVTRNQLATVMAGLAPVRSIANVASGIRDVVAIPIREYRKDGRIVRSIQKGAFQFGKTTASELVRLGAKVALGTQTALSNAESFLSPAAGSAVRPRAVRRISSEQGWHEAASDDDEPGQRAVSAYANQPLGVLSGLRSARRHLEYDLLTVRDAFIAVQGELLESRTPGGAAAAIARHAPTVILRPVIGATRAVGTTLLGVGNQIDRDNVRRVDDKYKRR